MRRIALPSLLQGMFGYDALRSGWRCPVGRLLDGRDGVAGNPAGGSFDAAG